MYSVASLIQFIRQTITECPTLEFLSLSQVILFIRLSAALRREILLVQPSDHPSDIAPKHLSPSIHEFLAKSCHLSQLEVLALWNELKDMVWHLEADILLESVQNSASFESLFQKYGGILGFSTAFPPLSLSIG